MNNPIPAEVGDYSEIRKHQNGSSPTKTIRRGVLAKLDSTGTVDIYYVTSGTRPTSAVLGSTTALYGVVVRDHPSEPDPIGDRTQNYGGQPIDPTQAPYIHVALMGAHRELIVPTINDSTGELDATKAVASNIGKGVTLYYQNYYITDGNNKHWCYVGASLGGNDGIIVGLAGKGRVIVRLKRSFFAEMQ